MTAGSDGGILPPRRDLFQAVFHRATPGGAMFSRLGPFSRFIARRFAPDRVVRRRFSHEALETRLALAVDPVAVDDPVVTFVGEPLQLDVTANDLVSDTGEPF